MPKTGISVTLRDDNLLWLRGRTKATGARSLSETLDALVSAARAGGPSPSGGAQSIAGSIDIAEDDPALEAADDYIRELFAASHARPFLVRERPPAPPGQKPGRPRRRRG